MCCPTTSENIQEHQKGTTNIKNQKDRNKFSKSSVGFSEAAGPRDSAAQAATAAAAAAAVAAAVAAAAAAAGPRQVNFARGCNLD